MAERHAPDAILEQTGLSGVLSAIQDDPDAPDGNWLTTNASGSVLRVSFPTPSASLQTGADLQEFRLWLRKDAAGGGDPTTTLELYENGSLVATLATSVAITSASGEILSGTWDASSLADGNGMRVELRLASAKGGGGPNERNVEIGAAEWNATVGAGSISGSGGGSIGAISASAAGAVLVEGTGVTNVILVLLSSASGAVLVEGSGVTNSILTIQSSAAGTVPIEGAGAPSLPTITASGTGIVGEVPIEGSGSPTLPPPALSSSGAVVVDGNGVTFSILVLDLSAEGTIAITGTAAVTLPDFTLVGAGTAGGEQGISGIGAATLPGLVGEGRILRFGKIWKRVFAPTKLWEKVALTRQEPVFVKVSPIASTITWSPPPSPPADT